MVRKIKWVKDGGYDGSKVIQYTSIDRPGYMIMRTRHQGRWSMPSVYFNDKFVHGFCKVAEAKAHVEQAS